ncbi:hypothetical protein [Methylobacterium oryzihabitans]|uniref:Uncharacterized protein n=1 Tax=Methylobacterium oryzihabitans TaxID=2499852 RepID=A0A3S2VQ80_9HYPH|nr:hypothetical protein [Methylobacterium oryzihabitans]RVU18177.1 hypothetical protein EOE48_12410 [Methylobacterium oryzihabitans]
MTDTRSDVPPTRTIEPIDTPPDGGRPTSAQLKADIDSGRTGDKVPVFDPGLSPLGTDDEAAGHPPTQERVALARASESHANRTEPAGVRGAGVQGAGGKPSDAHHTRSRALPLFLGFIALAAVVVVVAVLWERF